MEGSSYFACEYADRAQGFSFLLCSEITSLFDSALIPKPILLAVKTFLSLKKN